MGTEVEDVEPFILRVREAAASLAAETPRNKVEVESFYLMPTEVTNEQYARFVHATGAKPPCTWAERALEQGRESFLAEERSRAQDGQSDQGDHDRAPREGRVFDPQAWWERNWRDCAWEVPEEKLTQPVTFVTCEDAEAYAAWAGLRLMTEFEYARACRGDSDRTYPWGDAWKPAAIAARLAGRDEAWPVGSFGEGAVGGIHDLAGNVWEWTQSPYTPLAGYEPIRVAEGHGRQRVVLDVIGDFDPDWRVAVGGSFASDEVAARVSTRRGTERFQATDGVGFRCAASMLPGRDAAARLLAREVDLDVLPRDQGIAFAADGALVKQRWRLVPGTCDVAGYAVIDGYDYVALVPVQAAPAILASSLRAESAKRLPIVLGLLATTEPIAAPALAHGIYFVAFRGAGDVPEPSARLEDQAERAGMQHATFADFALAPGFDPEVDSLLFFDRDARPVAAVPCGALENDALRERGTVRLESDGAAAPDEARRDTLRFRLGVAGADRSKGLWLDLALEVAPGGIASW